MTTAPVNDHDPICPKAHQFAELAGTADTQSLGILQEMVNLKGDIRRVEGDLHGMADRMDRIITNKSIQRSQILAAKLLAENPIGCRSVPLADEEPDPPNSPTPSTSGLTPKVALLIVTGILVGTLLAAANYTSRSPAVDPSDLQNQAFEAQTAGQFGKACDLYVQAMKAGAQAAPCLQRKAECEVMSENYSAALATCDDLLKATPGNPIAYYIRGATLEKSGKTDEAKKQYSFAAGLGDVRAARQVNRLNRPLQVK
jgi:tetratricopeptide (TPR) repeat protein